MIFKMKREKIRASFITFKTTPKKSNKLRKRGKATKNYLERTYNMSFKFVCLFRLQRILISDVINSYFNQSKLFKSYVKKT